MASLTQHDISILEKIKDPEAGPSAPLLIDPSLPKDPNISDATLYQKVSNLERTIVASIQEIELQIAGLKPTSSQSPPPLSQYLNCVKTLDDLIQEYPKYASARNNRAQALRRIYGDGILVKSPETYSLDEAKPLYTNASDEQLIQISSIILTDLTTAISLLTPRTPYMPLSPQSARTLSQAYTQRGAFYHLTAKRLSLKGADLRIEDGREEKQWKTVEFEEHASRDFVMGGRYGNEIAKALAVSANPTAKLCGEMVREAMRKEYAGAGQSV
ncbi:hypothetical protein G7Y89_g4866 [Cudoniella acicularis]|uniref:Uncharacterized protein n=1 Tax=Cudoniella acicularis TaxID=354080 RepID=A0A8H4RNL5_9HELO|nr:hypothetical protein G7Y89_g4866 [Cudoniella acicularis]